MSPIRDESQIYYAAAVVGLVVFSVYQKLPGIVYIFGIQYIWYLNILVYRNSVVTIVTVSK